MSYRLHFDGSPYNYQLFETANLNPCGKQNQKDGIFQALKVIRPDLTDKEIVTIITKERIRRAEMDICGPMIGRIIKETAPEYSSTKVNKKNNLKEIIDMFPSGITVIRMGTEVVTYDADKGEIYTSLKELYSHRPVTEYWRKNDAGR